MEKKGWLEMKEYDVTALGEILIDFTENGKSEQGNVLFEANPGGAPCNVLAMLAKLGHKTAFVGKAGEDTFGYLLKNTLSELRIDSRYLYRDMKVQTTLAFVHTFSDGERDFSFYRNPGADMMLEESEVPEEAIASSRIFHFGSLSMTHEKVRKATKKAVRIAQEKDVVISFDPNLRAFLWDSLENAKEQIMYGIEHCDILKISDNEIQWLTGELDYTKGVEWIRKRHSVPLILVTMGKEGSRAYEYDRMVEVPSFPGNAIEATGAGDTFFGCVLHYLLEHDREHALDLLSGEELREMLIFANAAAHIITTRKGALRVMPDKEEILSIIA